MAAIRAALHEMPLLGAAHMLDFTGHQLGHLLGNTAFLVAWRHEIFPFRALFAFAKKIDPAIAHLPAFPFRRGVGRRHVPVLWNILSRKQIDLMAEIVFPL